MDMHIWKHTAHLETSTYQTMPQGRALAGSQRVCLLVVVFHFHGIHINKTNKVWGISCHTMLVNIATPSKDMRPHSWFCSVACLLIRIVPLIAICTCKETPHCAEYCKLTEQMLQHV